MRAGFAQKENEEIHLPKFFIIRPFYINMDFKAIGKREK